MHRTALCLLALASALPVAVVVLFGIWAPTAVLWETFGVHYTALPTFALGYHFIGNAMGFAVLYTYAPSYMAHFWLDPAQPSTMQLYSLTLFGVHAIYMLGVALWMATRPLGIWSKVAILAVTGILPFWMGGAYINFLTTNYFWLAAVLLPLAATSWVEAMLGKLDIRPGFAVFIGLAVAAAVWTKFTYAAMLAPFLAAPLFFAGGKGCGRNILLALAGCAMTTIALGTIYFAGHFEYAERFARDLLERYSESYLSQRNPALWDELMRWLNVRSALQCCVLLALAATAAGIFHRGRLGSLASSMFLAITLAVGALFVPFLLERASGNTFVDAILFLSFVTATWSAVLLEQPAWRLGAAVSVLYVALTAWQVFGVFRLQEWIPRLQSATSDSLAIVDDIASRRPLPVVYYWHFLQGRGQVWHGAPLWASPYLYALVSGEQLSKLGYLHKYFPGVEHRSALDGPLARPHVLVVQEHSRAEPSLNMTVFGTLPAFDGIVSDSRNSCRRRRVEMAWTDFDTRGGAFVTVCTVQ